MSVFRSPTTVIAAEPQRQRQMQRLSSRWRMATLAASASIGESGWHWTELKKTAAPRVSAVSTPGRPRSTKRRARRVEPAVCAPQWHA